MVDQSLLGLARRLGNPLANAGGHPHPTAVAVRDALDAYREGHRRYHTTQHLREMVVEVARLEGAVPPAFAGAIIIHDVVYDPERDDNELASADRARVDLDGLVAEELVATVVRLVLLTAEHEVDDDDALGALVVDADLWILASPPPRYDRYVQDVRREYAHLDEATWRQGRAEVLRHLRARMDAHGFLVGERPDRQARTRQAVVNIERELHALEA
ncbi:MAG TPA: hypothetical protein VJ978_03670 [Nitriliruptoraceae bacterium]|nr:hypothetical protein [Nitriliruptoraceae bacterium]